MKKETAKACSIENFQRKASIGADFSNISKYSSILMAVPAGSIAFTTPENTNHTPTKYLRKLISKLLCLNRNFPINVITTAIAANIPISVIKSIL